jgi:hypothetical protein
MKAPRNTGLAFVLASLATIALAGAASATTIQREHYSGTDSFSYDDCGPTVDVEVSFSGVAHLRVGKGKDASAFFLHDNYEYREVHTSETGAVLIVTGNGVFQEVEATRIEGTTFRFSAVNSGQVFTVTDESGNVLARDRGTVRETILLDTKGDDVPGGIFIEQLAFELRGPHPGFEFDFCTILG